MSIEFPCAGCGRQLRTPDEAAGKMARCPDCGETTEVPAVASPFAPLHEPKPPVSQSSNVSGQPASNNPYQSPNVVDDYGYLRSDRPYSDVARLSSRGKRFVGRLIDNIITALGTIPAFAMLMSNPAWQRHLPHDELPPEFWLWAGGGALAINIIPWWLIATSGQSIGKKLLGMRIVRYGDNTLPGFSRGVFVREWVVAAIANLPVVGGLFGLADALTIFGQERRCIHDFMADTKVVDV